MEEIKNKDITLKSDKQSEVRFEQQVIKKIAEIKERENIMKIDMKDCEKEIIKFGVWLTGKDYKRIKQMFDDYNNWKDNSSRLEPPVMQNFTATEEMILKALLVDKMVAFKFALNEVTGYGDIERKNMERDILAMNEIIKKIGE